VRAFDVVAAVADHDGVLPRELRVFLQHVGDDLVLARALLGEGAADDVGKILPQTEAHENALGELLRLRGGDDQAAARLPERGQKINDAGVGDVFKDAPVLEIDAELLRRALGLLAGEAVFLLEGFDERGADEGEERRAVGHVDAEARERVGHGLRDALAGVGERAVEIEENGFHPTNSSRQRE